MIPFDIISQEVGGMATKSILKNVTIKDKRLAQTFVEALEQAENTKYKSVKLNKHCEELTGEQIKKFFENK